MYYSRQPNHNYIYNFSLVIGLLILILAVPLSFLLPVSISFENGLLENLQVVVLIFSGLYNLFLTNYTTDKQIKAFNIWCAALSILLACRELSWGRVFYQMRMEATGPVFIDMSNYIYRTEAYIFIVSYMLILLITALLKLPLKKLLRCRFPIMILFIMFVSIMFSYIGDHGIIFGKLQGQIVEEFGELSFYTLIPALCIHYYRELEK